MADVSAVLTDMSGAEVIITGAITLILKLKAIIDNQSSDVKIAIQNLDADATSANASAIAEAQAWAKANGLSL